MSALVVYRDFGDGTDEIGILTLELNTFWIHVGDFDYCFDISNPFNLHRDYHWIIVGVL